MTVGKRIRDVRENIGMSQVEFATAIGVTKQTLYKYENDLITNIPSDKIEAAAKIGHVTPAYLMGWDEDDANIQQQKYYYDDETAEILEAMATNPKLKALFYAQRNMNEDEVNASTAFYDAMTAMKRKEERLDNDPC